MTFTPKQIEQLSQPLDRTKVKHRDGGGGRQLAYIAGHYAIDRANEIFGFGQWGSEVLALDLVPMANTDGAIVGQMYIARVRVIVDNCKPFEDVGFGVVKFPKNPNPSAIGDAYDMAAKTAITDALKRALRYYGDQFGNSLYDTDLVDGQPGLPKAGASNNNSNGNSRPARPAAPAPVPQSQQTQTAKPVDAPTTQPQAQPKVQPVPTSTVSPLAASAVTEAVVLEPVQMATEQQRATIERLAKGKKLTRADVERQAGRAFETISHSEAGELIKWLAEPVAK